MRRVLWLMRENDLLTPEWGGSPLGSGDHDGIIVPETVDTMSGTDLTFTVTREDSAAIFIAIDHCSAECIGIHAHARALEPIRQGVRRHFGGFAEGIAHGLAFMAMDRARACHQLTVAARDRPVAAPL